MVENTTNLVQTTQNIGEDSLQRGELFTFRETFELSDQETLNVIIQLDSSSTSIMRVVDRIITADEELTGTIGMNADIDTNGTAFSATNNLIDDSVTDIPSDITIESGGTYSNETDTIPVRVFSGSKSSGSESAIPAQFRVTPGNSVLYKLTSQKNSNTVLVQFLLGIRPT